MPHTYLGGTLPLVLSYQPTKDERAQSKPALRRLGSPTLPSLLLAVFSCRGFLDAPPLHPTRALRVAPPYLDAGQNSSSAPCNWANGFSLSDVLFRGCPSAPKWFISLGRYRPHAGGGVFLGVRLALLCPAGHPYRRTLSTRCYLSPEFDQSWARRQKSARWCSLPFHKGNKAAPLEASHSCLCHIIFVLTSSRLHDVARGFTYGKL